MVGAVTGCTFGLANAVGGELFARQAYPLVVHLPLVIYLCALSPEPAARYAGCHQCLSELPVQQLDGHRRARRHRLANRVLRGTHYHHGRRLCDPAALGQRHRSAPGGQKPHRARDFAHSALCFLPFICANTRRRKSPSASAGCSRPATTQLSKSSRLGANLDVSFRSSAMTYGTSCAAMWL